MSSKVAQLWLTAIAALVASAHSARAEARAVPEPTSMPSVGSAPDNNTHGEAQFDTPPDWIRKPSGYDIAAVYPRNAQMRGVEGRGVIKCNVAKSGKLIACTVIEESPPGYGFGKAAVALEKKFQMMLPTLKGVPVGGGTVTIPILFRLPR